MFPKMGGFPPPRGIERTKKPGSVRIKTEAQSFLDVARVWVLASDFIVVYLISKTLPCSEPRNPQKILLFFKVFKNALFWGARRKKKGRRLCVTRA